MPFDERYRADFETAMGESFADAVSPPIPLEDASPHECAQAVTEALGPGVTPRVLVSLTPAILEQLAAAFGAHFECEAPTGRQVADAIARTLARWPPDDEPP